MADLVNVYCDESCHLERDGIPVMVLGAVWCKAHLARRISLRIGDIKLRHGLPTTFEVKWSHVTANRLSLYLDLVDYFFAEEFLHFRGVLIPNKGMLHQPGGTSSHDDWYYRLCFELLDSLVDPRDIYGIYLDITDTRSERNRADLEDRLQASGRELDSAFLCRVQHIRSHESEILQLCDLLIGAIGYEARGLTGSVPKSAVVRRIGEHSGQRPESTRPEPGAKYALRRWRAEEVRLGS